VARKDVKLFIDGQWRDGGEQLTLTDKFDGTEKALVQIATKEQVSEATLSLLSCQESTTFIPYDRYVVLSRLANLMQERSEEIAQTIVSDSGLTISDARNETNRATQTIILCAEESKRITGEVVAVSGAPGYSGRIGFTVRHPMGVVCAITPFNAPLNTVCHKVGPAIAAGNTVVIKPAAQTPMTSELLLRLLLEAGLPPKRIALIHGPGSTVGQWLLEDPIPAFYAFTGSTEVGLHITRTVGVRKTQLELGSLSSTIVCDDADVSKAAALAVNASFRKAGQVCTSIQRLYVQQAVVERFLDEVTTQLQGKKFGDPTKDETFVGPLITPKETERVESWVNEALNKGASLAFGGKREGNVFSPTVLTNVNASMTVMQKEIFGPVVTIRPFRELDEAIREANDTPYGLAAGIFTQSIERGLTAAQQLRFGSVHINETSSSRLDLYPYGGVKMSGHGKEGPKYAIMEMTEERLITIAP
jgi:succinate-semialdehyde dehydrogenase/glutarate-semialdehyde dehydrogenase